MLGFDYGYLSAVYRLTVGLSMLARARYHLKTLL